MIDIKQIFKGMRKDFEFMKSVFQKVGTQILGYIKEAKNMGQISSVISAGEHVRSVRKCTGMGFWIIPDGKTEDFGK